MNNQQPQADGRIEEVWRDLSKTPPSLNPKWFYDAQGSRLFDEITRQPEYYLTACELNIITAQGAEIGRWIGPGAALVELGAGNGEKAVLLLHALQKPAAYVPVDISRASLETAVHTVRKAMPQLRVEALCQDFGQGFSWPSHLSADCRCLAFLGSTIGNMEPFEAGRWLGHMANSLHPGDKMLIGVDLKKDPRVLNAAYNDANGVTADFNRNALAHLNRALNTRFDVAGFLHRAYYNERAGCIEMHLQAISDQMVEIGPYRLKIAAGEHIHTENSYKYTVEEFGQLARDAGFETDMVWCDQPRWFSLHGLRVTKRSRH